MGDGDTRVGRVGAQIARRAGTLDSLRVQHKPRRHAEGEWANRNARRVTVFKSIHSLRKVQLGSQRDCDHRLSRRVTVTKTHGVRRPHQNVYGSGLISGDISSRGLGHKPQAAGTSRPKGEPLWRRTI